MSDSEPNQRRGRFVETSVAGEMVRAFIRPALPPLPAIDVLSLLERLSLAERALGRLDGITMLLPRQELFLYMYVRRLPTGVSKPIEPVSFLESGEVHQVYHLQFGQRLRLQ